MSGLVSVVIPAYNVSRYIEDCIKSVLNQTYAEWEMLVIDDGSTDNTFELAKNIAGSDARIHIHQQNNQGVSVARNTGLSLAKGSGVIFLDGDDFWLPDCLEKLVAEKEQSESHVIYCGYNHFYSNGFNRNYRYGYPGGDILIPAIKGEVRFQIGAMLIDKKLLDEHHLTFTPGCLVGQDLEFMLKLAAVATYKSVPQNLLMYRVRPNSTITSKWKWEKHFHAIEGVRRAAEFIIERSQGRVDLDVIKAELDVRIAKLLSKFMWRIVKTNSYERASELIEKTLTDPFYALIQKNFSSNKLEFSERIKYRIVCSKKRPLWNLAKYI